MFKKKEKRVLSEEEVRDLVDHLLRSAFQEQGRDLEKHLTDIHQRLTKLEKSCLLYTSPSPRD